MLPNKISQEDFNTERGLVATTDPNRESDTNSEKTCKTTMTKLRIANSQTIDFDGLADKPQNFADHYESRFNCFLRTFFLCHTIAAISKMLSLIKQKEKVKQPGEDSVIQAEKVKCVKYKDSSLYLGNQFAEYLNDLRDNDPKYKITIRDLYKMVYRLLKSKIWAAIAFSLTEILFRLGFSIALQQLLKSVTEGNKQMAYILAICAGLCYFLSQISRQNMFFHAMIVGTRLRSGLTTTLFAKLSGFSQFTYQTSELSKVVNMLSNDMNVIELQLSTLFIAIFFPFALIAIAVILVFRFGWQGIIGVVLPIALFPLQRYISKKNGQLLKNVNASKDMRLQICTEIIEGIKFVKLYGWELAFKKIIQNLRDKEIQAYIKLNFGRGVERALGNCVAFWSALALFLTIHYTNQPLSTSIIFSTLELMVFLKTNIFFFAIGVGFYYQLNVIFERFANVFNIENIQMREIDAETKKPVSQLPKNSFQSLSKLDYAPSSKNILESGEIVFRDFNGYWSTTNFDKPSLTNINLNFKKGHYYGICGPIGSGKSSLLAAILNEMPYFSGILKKKGTVTYVEQEPVIFSASVKDNILFNKPYDEKKYKEVIKKSCMERDLTILSNGDQTVIGEKGATLSGGQRARIALARAMYADGDIYLLDDPISAVDTKVAKEMYENVILPLSKQKTLILVTHQVHFLFDCDEVIVMENGAIKNKGLLKNLKNQLESIYNSDPAEKKRISQEVEQIALIKEHRNRSLRSSIRKSLEMMNLVVKPEESTTNLAQVEAEKPAEGTEQKEVTKAEKEEVNVKVTAGTYTSYIFFKKANRFIFPITIFFFIASELVNTVYMRVLADYDHQLVGKPTYLEDFKTYWIVLGSLQFLYFLLLCIKYILLSIVVLGNNKNLHDSMITTLLRCPSSYFDVTPTGRLLNNFSNDLGILDNNLTLVLLDVIEGPITCIIMLANICQINPLFIPAAMVAITCLLFFFSYCKPAIIESKQMDLRTKTPVFKMFREMLSGSIQIRIFGRRKSLLKEVSNKINTMTRVLINSHNCKRGYSTYVAFFTSIILLIGYVSGVWTSSVQTAGLYAISAIFFIQINFLVDWFLRQTIELQSLMLSVERVKLLVNEKPEKELRNDYDKTIGLEKEILEEENVALGNPRTNSERNAWPEKASLEFKNLTMKYRPELPDALKKLNFKVMPGEKVGIVGRTGAGKSSIVQAIFRMCELEEGSEYRFGAYDAIKMGLHSLRQHISVIPQTPFIFKGTIRQNLDPFERRTDEEIWQALEDSDLATSIRATETKLDTVISNSSQVFSVGQKQLLCLARALLNKDNKFLVLDEATSNVDMRTDSFIQKVLKTKFKDTTVITIAHRLDTIADYDKIIVMNKKQVAEFGSPHELIARGGLFCDMVSHTGKNAEKIKKIAREKHQQVSCK